MLYLNIMININTNKQLGIILPNTNRALAEVLKNISSQELETLSKSKDIRSILNSLLKDTLQNPKSDKLLLELMKNNPTLKKIGNVSNTIKDLLASLKSDQNPLPIEKVLKDFLVDIKQLSEPILKDKIINSGVFMESKLKNVKNPQVEIKNILESLAKSIEKSEFPIAKELDKIVTKVLSQKILKEASDKALIEPPNIEPKDLKQLSTNIKTIVTKIQDATKLVETLSKLETLIKMENLQPSKIQEVLKNITLLLSQTKIPSSQMKTISNEIEKIVQLVETLKSDNVPEKIIKEVRVAVDSLKETIQKIDPLFSKELISISKKLSSFNTPQKLMLDAQIKEILSTDLKSLLIQASDEIAKSSHPNQSEILKQVDKLLLQIDYHQMISHLSNSTSLYIPFAWNEMQEGNINIKHSDDNKFYCDIELNLKEHGELRVRLALYDENQLNIYLYSKDDNFRDIIQENIGELRSLLIGADINPRDIRVFDADKKSLPKPYKNYRSDIDMGFDIKV